VGPIAAMSTRTDAQPLEVIDQGKGARVRVHIYRIEQDLFQQMSLANNTIRRQIVLTELVTTF
jgi:hypothetical protein